MACSASARDGSVGANRLRENNSVNSSISLRAGASQFCSLGEIVSGHRAEPAALYIPELYIVGTEQGPP